jgi:predicted metal-dependent HD superfamily phosphohydrolase
MPVAALKQTWEKLISRYCANEHLVSSEFDKLAGQYTAPGRYYHNLRHLEALLTLQQAYASSIRNNDVLQLAIFYHDIIYNVLQSDNEEQSALAAGAFLRQTTFPPYQIITVMDYIRATKTHTSDEHDDDLDFLLDFDLSILGSSADVYRQYTEQIRQEYSMYPDEVYNLGRKKVLMHFLEKPVIYRTTVFREQYEARARLNIASELQRL